MEGYVRELTTVEGSLPNGSEGWQQKITGVSHHTYVYQIGLNQVIRLGRKNGLLIINSSLVCCVYYIIYIEE